MPEVKIGYDNKIHGLDKDTFEPGEKVIFRVPVVYDATTSVTSDQVHLQNGETKDGYTLWSFLMPDHDVTVNIRMTQDMMMKTPVNMMNTSLSMMNLQQTSVSGTKPKFCRECGSPLNGAEYCPSCGTKAVQ